MKRLIAILILIGLVFQPCLAVTFAQLKQAGYGNNNTYYFNTTYVNATGITVLFEYSTDGSSWHGSPQAGDAYFRQSSDGGSTWGGAVYFMGPQGQQGIMNQTANMTAGPQGLQGNPGPTGPAGQVYINNTFTGPANSSALVVNVGNSTYAKLDFTIPGGGSGGNAQLPVGSVIGTSSYLINPATIFGYGTWQLEGNLTCA